MTTMFDEKTNELLDVFFNDMDISQKERTSKLNRLGDKKDGSKQKENKKAKRTPLSADTASLFKEQAEGIKKNIKRVERQIVKVVKDNPFIQAVKEDPKYTGLGPVKIAALMRLIDPLKGIAEAWMYCGYCPDKVQGKKWDKEEKKWVDGKMIDGDKRSEGHRSPFNGNARALISGIIIPSMMKKQIVYKPASKEEYDATPETRRKLVASDVKNQPPRIVVLDWEHMQATFPFACKYITTKEKELIKLKDKKNYVNHADNRGRRIWAKELVKEFLLLWKTMEGLPMPTPWHQRHKA